MAVEDVKDLLLQALTDITGPRRRFIRHLLHEVVEVVRDVKTRRGQHPRDKQAAGLGKGDEVACRTAVDVDRRHHDRSAPRCNWVWVCFDVVVGFDVWMQDAWLVTSLAAICAAPPAVWGTAGGLLGPNGRTPSVLGAFSSAEHDAHTHRAPF